MSLETFGFIKDLTATNPTSTDPKSQGDDHLRGIKSTLKAQFSGFTQGKAITVNEDQVNGIATLQATILSAMYPIGSIYISATMSTSPGSVFGGNWVRLGEGRTLIDAGSTYTAGSAGGAATHSLTNEEMPSHNHFVGSEWNVGGTYGGGGGGNSIGGYQTTYSGNPDGIGNSGRPHNNMPPYIAVYIWKRIA